MKIISIDVGIKNLAYCIVDHYGSDNYNILDWDVIDLCGEEHICNCLLTPKLKVKKLKKGEKRLAIEAEAYQIISLCNKKAIYCKADKYYCLTHAKKATDYMLPNADLKNVKKWKLEALVAYAEAQNISLPANYKKPELIQLVLQYIREKTLEKIAAVTANEMTLVNIGVQLVKAFDLVLTKYDFELDKIIIENQISPIANRMKTLQGMIAQYFIMRGMPNISFISSANKLNIFTKKSLDINETPVKGKTSYSERKKASVAIVKEVLNTSSKDWLQLFLKHKKKDDLADAFLQGMWFLNKHNL